MFAVLLAHPGRCRPRTTAPSGIGGGVSQTRTCPGRLAPWAAQPRRWPPGWLLHAPAAGRRPAPIRRSGGTVCRVTSAGGVWVAMQRRTKPARSKRWYDSSRCRAKALTRWMMPPALSDRRAMRATTGVTSSRAMLRSCSRLSSPLAKLPAHPAAGSAHAPGSRPPRPRPPGGPRPPAFPVAGRPAAGARLRSLMSSTELIQPTCLPSAVVRATRGSAHPPGGRRGAGTALPGLRRGCPGR